MDSKVGFEEHIRMAANKAKAVTMALNRLMTNIGGPGENKRHLFMTTDSILLYAAELWGDKIEIEVQRKCMAAVQRAGKLRIASSYGTVSKPGILMVATYRSARQRAKENI